MGRTSTGNSDFRRGRFADAVDLGGRQVLELKPNNPRAIARGLRQAEGYAQQLDMEFPLDPANPGANPFEFYVVTYDVPDIP
jgi:hypothetical protein